VERVRAGPGGYNETGRPLVGDRAPAQEVSVKRLAVSALLLATFGLAGCAGLEGILPFAKADATRKAGQWQNTVLSVQKFGTVVFRDKSGKPLTDDEAKDANKDDLVVDAGGFEELLYRKGRVRYATYPAEKNAQPLVVERAIGEKDFEALDEALYKDKFFTMKPTTSTGELLPVFVVQYDQAGRGGKNVFAPNMGKLVKTNPILTGYFDALSGESKLEAGSKQIAYYMAPSGGNLQVSISTLTPSASGEPEEKPWVIKSATADFGKGAATGTVSADGASFTVPLPTGDANFQLMSLKVASDAEAAWETLIPVRAAGK
jgi:hypothetical protein